MIDAAPPMMPPEEFRRLGHEVVDWIAAYLDHVRDYPVLPSVRPGELVDSLPSSAPDSGEPVETLLEDFRDQIVPRLTHWNHPRFLGYFATTASSPGILAEMLAAAVNVNHMLWKTSPAATELEQVTLSWLRQWLGLPEDFFGIIYDTASTSTLHALAAARESADPDARRRGVASRMTVYCSEQAHSSVDKAAITIGVGHENVRKIPVDAGFRMRPDDLETSIGNDRAAGARPFCVVATVGTTPTTSIDPVAEIARIARREGLWLHVDGAYGGLAAIAPEYQWVLDGAVEADSLVVNPHKWLFTPVDLSAFYTRRPEMLRRAFTLVPDYLETRPDPRAVNLMDYGFQLGRRFRSLKLWFVMRYFGRQGVARVIRNHMAMAREFECWVRGDPRFEIAAPVPLSVVCFRVRGANEINQRLLDRINASGVALLSHAVLDGRFVLRLAIGNMGTTRQDLAEVWRWIQDAAARTAGPPPDS